MSNPLDPIPIRFRQIDGIQKLQRSIRKELDSPSASEKCSNLPHLLSIIEVMGRPEHDAPSAVLKPFTYSSGRTGRLIVDIVSSNGDCWMKVSARNPKSLAMLAAGGGGFGQKSIVDHAQDYLACAQENQCFFKPPKVAIIFTSGINESLAEELEDLGVQVDGERILDEELGIRPRIQGYKRDHFSCQDASESDDEDEDTKTKESSTNQIVFKNPTLEGITKLNLDITAFLAYCSNLTNGHTAVEFKKLILAQQCQFEKERPQLPILNSIFEGKELYCCETALNEFQSILSTVGGPEEKKRATEFLKRMNIVPDQMSHRTSSLDVSGNIRHRSLIIFGTGDSIEAVTVTANSGFVRSAKTQGVDFPVFLHESRALTEQKENNVEFATKLDS